jgi:hypothetical protein
MLEKTLRSVFARSIRPTYLFFRDGLTDLMFERPRRLHTSEIVRLEALGLSTEERVEHRPSGWLTLRRSLPKRDVSEDDVFIDFGSGMGLVVVEATRYRFFAALSASSSQPSSTKSRRRT